MKISKKLLAAFIIILFTVVCVAGVSAQEADKININKASLEELTKLKRIGKKYAERIIKYREEHGPFKRPEDIMNVSGIGRKTWEANKDQITVE